MSDILERDMAYQFSCGVTLNAAKFHVQIGTLENSRISRLLESNASENHGNAFFKTVFALTRSHRQEPISGNAGRANCHGVWRRSEL